MNDPDVIAYLFAADGVSDNLATDAIYIEENKHRFVPARQRKHNVAPAPLKDDLGRWMRAATEQPEEDADEKENADIIPHDGPCLALRFSQPPKTRRGLMVGPCPDLDIVMPKLMSISWYHFTFTFDDENLLIIRDLGSTVGTRVLYGDSDEDAQRGFSVDFSAQGPNLLKRKPPVIKIRPKLQFKLVVPNHDTTSPTYLANVARFREGTAGTENLFADLALRSRVTTELPTPSSEGFAADAEMPGKIMWMKELARGAFAVVKYAWDVQTRKVYALKTPLPGSKYKTDQWRPRRPRSWWHSVT